MLNIEQLREMQEELYVYDVEQKAWEQEPNGFEANATHVLTHLTKDITGKDFTDRETITTQIAPDSMQYALRLARWIQLPVPDLLPKTVHREKIRGLSRELGTLALPHVAFIEAAATLARNIHDRGHAKERARAVAQQEYMVIKTGGLLVYSACMQSDQYRFDLKESFGKRLADLRVRFNIPEPSRHES